MKYTLPLIFALSHIVAAVNAQDFEADSVYYTPISKSVESPKKKAPAKIFVDTVQHGKSIEYFFNIQVGPLIGCNDCGESKEVTFTSSTIHGITIGKKLRTGIGIGFDSYDTWQTMPVFGSASWDLIGTKNTQALFVQFNYGWAQPWRNKAFWDNSFTEVDGGRMVNTLIGYRIKYHDIKISIAAGWKFQRVFTIFETPTYYFNEDGTLVQGAPNRTSIKEDMSRLMFSLAIGWK